MAPDTPVGKAKSACLMSHVRLWERLVEQPGADDSFYMILEDDTVPSADFSARFPDVLAELADQPWDWVRCYSNFVESGVSFCSLAAENIFDCVFCFISYFRNHV